MHNTTRNVISIHAPRAGSDSITAGTDTNIRISIHAPRAGSDCRRGKGGRHECEFQSTLPVRGATRSNRRTRRRRRISIHAPRAGSDLDGRGPLVKIQISIHAPRAGSDGLSPTPPPFGHNFNPRSPCGERRRAGGHQLPGLLISIHAPRAGSDRCPGR